MKGIKIYYFETLDSTNNKAKEIETGEKEYIIYTDNQTNGRGQYDRKWISKNGLTFSLVVKKENNDYSSIVPKAIIEYLKYNGFCATIKYPNDIYYKDKKLGGILIENIYKENKYDKTIIGIGLNINENKDVMNKVENSIGVMINENKESIIKNISDYILKIINN